MAARSVFQFFPSMGGPYGSAFPEPIRDEDGYDRGRLRFDGGTDEYWVFEAIAPVDITTPMTAYIKYAMVTENSGTIAWSVAVEAITDGDHDLTAGNYFDSENAFSADTVPATLGQHKTASKELTNADSISAGDLVRFRVLNDVSGGSTTGEADFLGMEIQDDGG